jgi:hypothetical protein
LLVLSRPKRRLWKENTSLIMTIKPIELDRTMKG